MLHKSKQYLTFCISQQMFSHIIHILSSCRIKNTAEWKQEHVICKGNTALTFSVLLLKMERNCKGSLVS